MHSIHYKPWDEYAQDVRSGKIPACKKLRNAVERYFRDMADPRYYMDEELVRKFINFAKYTPHVKGHLRGKPIILEPWQTFLFANVIGMKRRIDGRRKYTEAFIIVPRKNAKSTTAAILVCWFMAMEKGQNDIFTAAVSRDQARIVFEDAKQMVILSPALQKRVKVLAHSMKAPAANSIAKPLAARSSTIEGTNPSLAIVDEYHLHADNSVYSALQLGMGARKEPLLFAITTAGSNTVSACKQLYDYCAAILDGKEENENQFALIYELDEESEVDNPDMWIKANPNLGVSVDVEQLAATVNKARGIGSEWTETLTKRFNIWCSGTTPWISPAAWEECAGNYSEADLAGRECFLGLDLSSTNDITSLCYVFPFGQTLRTVTRHFIPEAQLENAANKNRALYRKWVSDGWLTATPGNVIDYDIIRNQILRDADVFQIVLVGFDTWNATHIRTQLTNAGLDVCPFPQSFQKFSPISKAMEVFVNRKILRHNADPVLSWAVGNIVMIADHNGNIKPTKKLAANKIDPVIALLMAAGTYADEYGDYGFEMTDQHKEKLKNFMGV